MSFKRKRFLYTITARTAAGLLAGCMILGRPICVRAEQTAEERLELQRAMTVASNEIPNWPTGPVVSAESAILIEAETGTILYSKNIHQRQYPASTTKILTTLIAAERCTMDEIVTFSNSAVFDTPRDSSHIAIDVGEELTMEQALNGILIASANEVSFAVAEHITGTTWQDFAPIMNERAAQLGCVDSNFVNPNGLPDENHYTSAYDLAMIGRAFFANELLCKISSSTVLKIPPSDKQPDDIIEYSRNKLLKGQSHAYEYIVGSKTGYTDSARSCLVSCAEKDGMKLICVVMKDESPMQFEDTRSLFDYGFSNFEKVNVSQKETKYNIDNAGFFYSENNIFGSSRPLLSLNREDCIILPKTAAFEDTVSSISYDTLEDHQVAVITYTYQDVFIGSASVDLSAEKEEAYSFDSSLSPEDGRTTGETDNAPNVIFINILRIFLWILGIAGTAGAVILVRYLIKNYHFTQRNNRRSWRRSRKKRQVRHLPAGRSLQERRRQELQARQRRKHPKKPNRFRDFDF